MVFLLSEANSSSKYFMSTTLYVKKGVMAPNCLKIGYRKPFSLTYGIG